MPEGAPRIPLRGEIAREELPFKGSRTEMVYMTPEEKMAEVLRLAEEALLQGELPIAAIIFHGDRVVSRAFTSEKHDGRFLVHAEMKALQEMDREKNSIKERREMQLFTNLEPCMMCFGAAVHSFVGSVFYALGSPTDGAAKWVVDRWAEDHVDSVFSLPEVLGGLLSDGSRALFERYLAANPSGGLADWVRTVV